MPEESKTTIFGLTDVLNKVVDMGFSSENADLIIRFSFFFFVLFIALVSHFLVHKVLLFFVGLLIKTTKTEFDDYLIKRKLFQRLSIIIPAFIIYSSAKLVFGPFEPIALITQRISMGLIIISVLLGVDSLLNAVVDIFSHFKVYRKLPIRPAAQGLKVIVFFAGGILILSTLMGKSPGAFFGGLGAMAAVLMLVFKDPILGFVAGIQLSANKLLHIGDWIEVPKYGADGDVIDITLTTVKVQNWDKTISSIPAYDLISGSFKNWRGMDESGGRRIKRSIRIDMSSIRFCDEAMLEKMQKVKILQSYLNKKLEELQEANKDEDLDLSDLANIANGRRLTNIGSFRAYMQAYLKNNRNLNQQMTFLVRQLAPTDKGLPLEMYVFSSDKAWANYEAIQADIMDHLLAVLPQFDLKVYQSPSGSDFAKLNS